MSVLNRVFVKNLRVFKERVFYMKTGVNIIVGANGSGKTSFMEAIYLLNFGKSFRTRNLNEIINGEEVYMEGDINKKGNKDVLRFYYKNEKKEISLNGEKKKVKDVLDIFFSMYINNTRIVNFFDSRREGRRLVDMMCSGIDSLYLNELLKYNRILRNRNKLLKAIKKEDANYKVWTESLVEQGEKLRRKRAFFIKRLNEFLGREQIEVKMVEKKGVGERLFVNEKRIKRTLFGPHLDFFKVLKKKRDVSVYGSTGINKTVFFEIIKKFNNIYKQEKGFPFFLMIDDFDSDLDESNFEKYIDNFDGQVLLSIVNFKNNFNNKFNLLEV